MTKWIAREEAGAFFAAFIRREGDEWVVSRVHPIAFSDRRECDRAVARLNDAYARKAVGSGH